MLGLGIALGLAAAACPAVGGRLWTPHDLPETVKANGGWWSPRHGGMTLRDNRFITSLPDQFGVRPMLQSEVSRQPEAALLDGTQGMNYATTSMGFQTEVAFLPVAWAGIYQLGDGTRATPYDWTCFVSSAQGDGPRVCLRNGTPNLHETSVYADTVSVNGSPPQNANVLPLKTAVIAFSFNSGDYEANKATPRRWGVGIGSVPGRGWLGGIGDTLAFGAVPSPDDWSRVQGYLAHAHGTVDRLPANHPFKAAPPMLAA